jgi:hypothetical protein
VDGNVYVSYAVAAREAAENPCLLNPIFLLKERCEFGD